MFKLVESFFKLKRISSPQNQCMMFYFIYRLGSEIAAFCMLKIQLLVRYWRGLPSVEWLFVFWNVVSLDVVEIWKFSNSMSKLQCLCMVSYSLNNTVPFESLALALKLGSVDLAEIQCSIYISATYVHSGFWALGVGAWGLGWGIFLCCGFSVSEN